MTRLESALAAVTYDLPPEYHQARYASEKAASVCKHVVQKHHSHAKQKAARLRTAVQVSLRKLVGRPLSFSWKWDYMFDHAYTPTRSRPNIKVSVRRSDWPNAHRLAVEIHCCPRNASELEIVLQQAAKMLRG